MSERDPGTLLQLALLVPLDAPTLSERLRVLSEEDGLFAGCDPAQDYVGAKVIAGTGSWSALIAWDDGVIAVADSLADALARSAMATVYALHLEGWDGSTAGTPCIDAHNGTEVSRVWTAGEPATPSTEDPFAFARTRLGRALPPYRAGALTEEPFADSRVLPLSILGARGPWPASFAVRLAGPDTTATIAAGNLDPRQAESFVGKRGAPGGLFDERIFGALRRDEKGRLRLEHWSDVEPRDRPQAVRFGAIVLPRTLIHPWVLRTSTGKLAELLYALADYRLVWHDDALVSPASLPTGAQPRIGGDVLFELVRRGDLPRDVLYAALRTLPVLPAGLRPVVKEGKRTLRHDASVLYDRVNYRVARVERVVELGAELSIVTTELAWLQRAVDALLVDGGRWDDDPELGTRCEPCSPDATPEVLSLRHLLAASPAWADRVDELLREVPARAFSKRWHAPAYLYRAWLEASGLELVPRGADGAVDERTFQQSLVDRRARAFGDVYKEVFGAMHPRVLHFDDDGAANTPPHIDVYATLPRYNGTRLILSAGASAAPMPLDTAFGVAPRAHVEFAMAVPAALPTELLEHLMLGLRALARYPFVNGTFFAPLHSVGVGRPLAPESALTAFVFVEPPERDLFGAFSVALPSQPAFLLAVGITETELSALSVAPDRRAMVDAIMRSTRGVTDLSRTGGLY